MSTDVSAPPRWFGAAEISDLIGMSEAIGAVREALAHGLLPEIDPPRSIVAAGGGQVLMMPAATGAFAGVKIATVAPGNPALGRPRIQGAYVLLDAQTLSVLALLDAAALTALRTPAVSAVAVDALAPSAVNTLVVFGSGPQARGHLVAVGLIRHVERVVVVGRDRDRAEALAADSPIPARVGGPADVADADVIVCATTARTPLFDGALVPSHATVVAVGSHQPDTAELDTGLMGRSTLVVEDPATALREAGEVRAAVDHGALRPGDIVGLADLVRGRARISRTGPRVFKSVGMSWEDLVVARCVYRSFLESGSR